MNSCHNMVIYDQWPYMTMPGTLEVMFTALREGIRIDRLLFEENREEYATLRKNCPLTVYLQGVGHDSVFFSDIMA